MARPIELKGVINGKTITLDDNPGLPEGFRVTLHLILTADEAFQLSAGGWADMTPQEIADFEQFMTEEYGESYRMPEPDPS